MEMELSKLLELSDIYGQQGLLQKGSLTKLLDKDLPVKTAYLLGKLSNKVQSELKQYYLLRDKLIKKYGKDDGGMVTIPQEDKEAMQKFNKENEELLSLKVNLNYDPIPVELLGDIKLSPADMGRLTDFFRES